MLIPVTEMLCPGTAFYGVAITINNSLWSKNVPPSQDVEVDARVPSLIGWSSELPHEDPATGSDFSLCWSLLLVTMDWSLLDPDDAAPLFVLAPVCSHELSLSLVSTPSVCIRSSDESGLASFSFSLQTGDNGLASQPLVALCPTSERRSFR